MTSTAIPKMLNLPTRSDDACESLRIRGRATGSLVVSGFASVWAGAGLLRSGAPAWAWGLLAIVALAFGVRAAGVLRGRAPVDEALLAPDAAARRGRARRIFTWAVAGEALGIVLAVNLAVNLGHPLWQVPAAMAVIGLHFLPLASGYHYRPHLFTGIALTAWALVFPWLFAAGPVAPAGMLGAAAILYASAAGSLHSAR
jgi:hypothetical protein